MVNGTKCQRCNSNFPPTVKMTGVTIDRGNDGKFDMIVCDDCYESLRLWLYGTDL